MLRVVVPVAVFTSHQRQLGSVGVHTGVGIELEPEGSDAGGCPSYLSSRQYREFYRSRS